MQAVRAAARANPCGCIPALAGRASLARMWLKRPCHPCTPTASTGWRRASSGGPSTCVSAAHRRLIVVDFDDTCTEGDTISHLVSATRVLQPAQVVEDKERTYKTLLREYIEERNELVDRLFNVDSVNLATSKAMPGSQGVGACPKRAWLEMFLHELSCFETRRNDVVLASGILHGATMETIARASQNVVFRDACLETLHQASTSAGTSVTVLSANWSEEFIRAALSNHHGAFGGFDADNVEIIANSLEFDAGMTTGGMRVRQCQTPNDKDRLLRELVGGWQQSVYVGDSVGDVPALLGSTAGIVMGNNVLLERVLERGGVETRDIEALCEDLKDWEGLGGENGGREPREHRVVYRTSSWEAIQVALGLQ